jgi:hypothetical protein
MSRIRCSRCTKKFDADQDYHSLCPDCWQEIGLYGDQEALRFWGAVGKLLNGEWTDEESKELADSAAGQEILKWLLDSMDIEMKIRLLKREVNQVG